MFNLMSLKLASFVYAHFNTSTFHATMKSFDTFSQSIILFIAMKFAEQPEKKRTAGEIFMTISAQPFYLWTLINTKSWKMSSISCSLLFNFRSQWISVWIITASEWRTKLLNSQPVKMNGRIFFLPKRVTPAPVFDEKITNYMAFFCSWYDEFFILN